MLNPRGVVGLLAVGLTVVAGCIGCGGEAPLEITGSGASFPAPLYQKWVKDYAAKEEGVKIDYSSVGSGTGIKDFTAGLTDFGASDAAMSEEEIAKVEGGVVLLPMTAGSVVLCYNVEDTDGKPVKDLKLSREAYTGIFLGKVKTWNDPLIQDANPDVKLPETSVGVVWRSDSSGTTYVFTKHLAAVSQEWADGPGVNKSVEWPTGSGAEKNDGIASAVDDAKGSIGYVEYGFAKENDIPMAILENKAGKFVAPTPESGQATLASVTDMPEDLVIWMSDPEAEDAYPIVTYTWMIFHTEYPEDKLKALKGMINYCLDEGQKNSESLGYIALPENVVAKVKEATDKIKKAE